MSSPEPEPQEAGIIFDEDEELPFIDIRERIDIDDVLQAEPLFTQYSDEQIYIMLQELTHHKAKSFMQIFGKAKQSQFTRNVLPQYDAHSIPLLAAGRVDASEEHEVNGETSDFPYDWNERIENALRAPNYRMQQSQKEQAWYHLEHILTDGDNAFVAANASAAITHIGLEGNSRDMTVLRKADPDLAQQVAGVHYRIPSITNESYLHEKVEHAHDDLVIVERKPSMSDALNKLPVHPSVHEVNTILAMHGFTLDALDEKQMTILEEELRRHDGMSDPDVLVNVNGSSRSPSEFLSSIRWDEALQNVQVDQLVQGINNYAEYFEAYVRNQSPQSLPIETPVRLHDIATGVANGQYMLEDVIASLSYARQQAIVERMRNVISGYQSIDASKKEKVLTLYASMYKQYTEPVAKHFLQMYQDVAKVQQGEDRADYDGNPADESQPMIPEETADRPERRVMDDWYNPLMFDDDTMQDENQQANESQADVPFTLVDYPQGVQEVLEVVVRDINALQKKAGVPFDFPAFLSYIIAITRIRSTTEVLKELQKIHPDSITDAFIQDMQLYSSKITTSMINQVQPESFRVVLNKKLSKHKDTVRLAQADAMSKALVWWTLYAQELALNRKLTRQLVKSQECMSVWSEWGIPLTKDEKGVLNYLLCNLQGTELSYITYVNLHAKVFAEIKEPIWKPRIDQLKSQFEDFGKDLSRVKEKTVATLKQLEIAYENAKDHRGYSKEFVNAVLSLPQLETENRGKGKFANGCCLQKLNPGFNANTDWQSMKQGKNLIKLRNKLGKERVTKELRKTLYLIGSMHDRPHPISQSKSLLQTSENMPDKYKIRDVVLSWQEKGVRNILMPAELINMYLTDNTQQMQRETENILQLVRQRAHVNQAMDVPSWGFTFENAISLLQQVAYHLKKSLSQDLALLNSSLRSIRDMKTILNEWLVHPQTRTEVSQVEGLLLQICARALCLPGIPNDSTLLMDGLSQEKTREIMKGRVSLWNGYMKTRVIPTTQKQQEFINLKREESKKKNVDELETLDIETRRLVQATRRLGLRAEVTTALQSIGERAIEEEGEAEFMYMGEDQDD